MPDRKIRIIIQMEDRDSKKVTANVNNLSNAVKNLTKSSSIVKELQGQFASFNQVFLGGFASNVFLKISGEIFNLAGLLKDSAIDAIRLGANFQVTENAVTVFAGSARLANEELKAISKTAEDTAGLRLIPAEEGYKRLRSLGFEAERSRKIIKELGEEKILSGVGDEEVQRIVYNFTQIASGGQKISQEIREILTAMPSLRKSFFEAFDTLNPQKIQAVLDSDPNQFFDKLISAMEKGKAVQGGLNDALGKFYDELTRGGRESSKPILQPLTDSIVSLTKYLQENRNTWASWGEYVKNVAKGVKDDFDGLNQKGSNQSANSWIKWYLGETSGINDLAEYFNKKAEQGGNLDRVSSVQQAQIDKLKKESDRIEEFKTELANKEYERIAKDEREKEKSLRILETYHSSRIAIIENSFSIESARLQSGINYTLEQQRSEAQKLASLNAGKFKDQIAAETSFFNERLRLNADNKLEIEKIELEKQISLGKIQTDSVTSAIKSAQEIEKIDREIIQRKRAAVQELNQLSANQIKQSLDTSNFNFDRSISLGNFDASAFNKFRDELSKSYADLSRLSSEFYRGQLLNESLTADERNNILIQLNQEQSGLAEDLRRKMLDIGDKQYAEQIKQLENYRDRSISVYQGMADFYKQIGDSLFSPQTFGSNTLGIVQETLLKQSKRSELSEQFKNATAEINRLNSAKQGVYDSVPSGADLSQSQLSVVNSLSEALTKAIDKEAAFRTELEKIENSIPNAFFQFEKLAKQISGGNVKAFDEAQRAFLEYRQLLERNSLQADISGTQDLIDLAKINKDAIRQKEYELKLSQLLRQQETQGLTQATEKTEQYRNSLQGLTEILEKLRSGDKSETVGFEYAAQQNILREQVGRYSQIIELEKRIADGGSDSAERYRLAWLSAIHAVKDANIQAVESQIQSQVKLADATVLHTEQIRAKVLEGLAQAKTINDAFADGILKTFDLLTDKLNKNLGKIGDIPIIGDLLKFSNQQVASNLTKGLLDALFPAEIVESFTKTKNPIALPIVEKLDKTNQILSGIAVKLGANPLTVSGGGSGGGLNLGSIFGGSAGGGIFNFLGGLFGGGRGASGNQQGFPYAMNLSGSNNGQLPTNGAAGDLLRFLTQQPNLPRDGGNSDIWKKVLGKGGIFGEKGFGNNVGTYGAIGGISSLFGGLVGGTAGSFISNIGGGLATGAQIGSMIMPGIGTAVGAAAGAVFGAIQSIFGISKRRKQEELLRSQALSGSFDALKQFDTLITDVRLGRIQPPSSAVPQGESLGAQVRAQYLQAANELKDKKTRNIALKDVSRIDSVIKEKMDELKRVAEIAQGSANREKQIIPEFATGNYFTDYFKPNGLLGGAFDRKDDILAMISRGEMVLNPSQISNVIRNAGGRDVFANANIPNYPNKPQYKTPKFATGAALSTAVSTLTNRSANDSSNFSKPMEAVFNISIDAEGIFIEGINSDSGERILVKKINYLKSSNSIK